MKTARSRSEWLINYVLHSETIYLTASTRNKAKTDWPAVKVTVKRAITLIQSGQDE